MQGYKPEYVRRRSVLGAICSGISVSLGGCVAEVRNNDPFAGPSADTPTLRWTSTFNQAVPTSPGLNADTVAVPHGGHISAVDTASGDIRWKTNVGSPVNPRIHDGCVYTRSSITTVSALDAKTGTERWRVSTDETFRYGPTTSDERLYMAGLHFGASPDGVIVNPTKGTLSKRIDIDQATVSPVLQSPKGVVVATAATPQTSEGQYTDGHLRRFDPGVTDEQWSVHIGGRPRPAVDEDAGLAFVGGTVDALRAISLEDGQILWRRPIRGLLSRPATGENGVYVAAGDTLHAVSKGSGETRWQFRPDAPLWGSRKAMTAPVVVGDIVVAGNDDGRLYAVDKADGSLRWTFETGGGLRAPPTVRDGTLYVAAQDTVYAIEM